MPEYTQEELQQAVDLENQRIAEVHRQATEQYMSQRVVELSVENAHLRSLLERFAPEALVEFDTPPGEGAPEAPAVQPDPDEVADSKAVRPGDPNEGEPSVVPVEDPDGQ